VHGFSWSFEPSIYRVTLDNEPPLSQYSGSTFPPDVSPGRIYIAGLTYFQANLNGSSHILTVDNDNGAGQIGLDYIEIISITGGVP
jgi:hypothetical protein